MCPTWQQDLDETGKQFGRVFFHPILLLALFIFAPLMQPARSEQSFAFALPELEGPVTLGIFSQEGALVRLLCTNAAVESLPAGLNGLIMTWDERDDKGERVPAGIYLAKGIVHGPLTFSLGRLPLQSLPSPCLQTPLNSISPRVQENTISVRASRDALMENPPLMNLAISLRENECIMTAEGLPILSIPLNPSPKNIFRKIDLISGNAPGTALLSLESPQATNCYTISGLDRLVPLSAGKLEVKPDAFHSSLGTGESAP